MSQKKRLLVRIKNDSFGGSESQFRLLLKYVPEDMFKGVNLILNNTDPKLIDPERKNILWLHHFVNMSEVQNIKSKDYFNKIDYFVFNSHWNYEKYRYQFNIPESQSVVLPNAIEEIDNKKKPTNKINLIYHTTPWRGLEILLNVFERLNLKNVNLNVCSSTIIYGNFFFEISDKKYEKIYQRCKDMKNVNYLGYQKHEELIKLLQETHVFAYPSCWIETSCISAIEAMAAGCQVVTSNLGALYETCSPFARLVHFNQNLNIFEKSYEQELNNSIKHYWSAENQKKLANQSQAINENYSWKNRSQEWIEFLKKFQ
jgi:glycosyltransferase involved in cell wall biosynthesis